MLKQRIENKAVPDSITDSDGRVYHRRDYEDEARPGYARVGRLYSSFELQCCGRWNLLSPSGFSFAAHLPVPPKPDPSHVSVSEAPANLREDVAQAEAALAAHRKKIAAVQERIYAAEVAMRRGIQTQNKSKYNAAVAAGMTAEEELKALIAEEPPFVKRLADANRALKFWQDDERMYRTGVVPRPGLEAAIF